MDGLQFLFRQGHGSMAVGNEIPDHNTPGTAGIDDTAPNFTRLPKAVVASVVFKTYQKSYGSTD